MDGGNVAEIGYVPPPVVHQPAAATNGVSTSACLYGQQQQPAGLDPDQQWVMSFVQHMNAINPHRVFLFLFINKSHSGLGLKVVSHFFGDNFLSVKNEIVSLTLTITLTSTNVWP